MKSFKAISIVFKALNLFAKAFTKLIKFERKALNN
jgi:hypothetical protein